MPVSAQLIKFKLIFKNYQKTFVKEAFLRTGFKGNYNIKDIIIKFLRENFIKKHQKCFNFYGQNRLKVKEILTHSNVYKNVKIPVKSSLKSKWL